MLTSLIYFDAKRVGKHICYDDIGIYFLNNLSLCKHHLGVCRSPDIAESVKLSLSVTV